MHLGKLLTFASLSLLLIVAPASAIYIRINTGGISFSSTGDINISGSQGTGTIDFNAPGYATLPTASSPDLGPGGSADFLLTNASTLTIDEGGFPPGIESGETGARSFSITLSAVQYSYVSSSGPWTSLASRTMTISSSSGTNVGQIPVQLGNLTDTVANESDAWDVRFLFDGVFATWDLGDGTLLRAQIFGANGFSGSSVNPIEWNYQGDQEPFYVRFTYEVPEPATYVLIGSALLSLAVLRRRFGARLAATRKSGIDLE